MALFMTLGVALGHGAAHIEIGPPRFNNPNDRSLPPRPDHDRLDKSKPVNPYEDMGCVQLYVLSTQKQDKQLQEEFEKKDCGAL